MRKWSPEAFTAFETGPGPRFEPFVGEAGSSASWRPTTPESDEIPLENPVAHIEQEFAERIAERERDHARELATLRGEFDSRLHSWSEQMEMVRRRDARRLAEEATRLAMALAEKVIRERVDLDRGVLVRNLETALYKIQSERPVAVIVHPDDAAWLESDDTLRMKLNIGALVHDRRIEVGGFRIRTDDGEWDATLKQQLATLGTLVEGCLETEIEAGNPVDPT